jgi:hypothetical protein
MSDPCVPAKQQKVGSNLKAHKALVAVNQSLVKRRDEPVRRAERKFLRARTILLRPIVKPATPIFGEANAVYLQALIRAGGNGVAIANARRRARRAIDRALRERFTRYHEYEALRRGYADELRARIATRRDASQVGGLDLLVGDVPLRPDIAFQVLAPPFALFDTVTVDPDIKSFTAPDLGLVGMNGRVHLEDQDTALIGSSYNPFPAIFFHALVGITFEVPQTGFLVGAAVMQNLVNDFTRSVTDKFGFSDARVNMDHAIVVRIVRSGEITPFERLVYSNGIQSFGQEFSFSESPIPRSVPFTLNFEPRDAFLKGERIQILAGASLTMNAHLNDMNAVMGAFTVWQVKKLSIGIRA